MEIDEIHPWDISVEEAESIQDQLKMRLSKIKGGMSQPKQIELIAACDVDYCPDSPDISAAVIIFRFPKLDIAEEVIVRKRESHLFPYIPGLLSFREGPLLIEALKKIESDPQIILFDGQGIAHPKRMGLATHLGLLLDKSTIGCAKSFLYGVYEDPVNIGGSYSLLKDENGELIGGVIRTRKDVKPIFVSPGYKLDSKTSIDIVLSCVKDYRIPEPLRIAHMKARGSLDR